MALSSVASSGPRVTKADVDRAGKGQPAAKAPEAEAGRRPRRSAPRARAAASCEKRRRRARNARAHVEAPRDDRATPGRSAADGRAAHDLQRSGHVGGDGAARAPQGDVQDAARHRARHRVVLCESRGHRAQGIPEAQRRDPGRRDRAEALLRHRHGGGRLGRTGRAGDSRRRPLRRSPASKAPSAISRNGRTTARSRSRICAAARSASRTAASTGH